MIPDGWRWATLGELTENYDAHRVPVRASDRIPGPYPYYGASGIVDYVDDYLFDGEYLLIAEDGENLRSRKTPVAFIARGKFWVNNHAHIVRGNEEADTRFLMYSIAATDISGYLSGSTQPKLTQRSLNAIRLLVPSAEEQLRIAELLGALDDKIEINKRINETLEEIARAIFRSWFIDSDSAVTEKDGSDYLVPLEELAILSNEKVDPVGRPGETFVHYSIPAYDGDKAPVLQQGSEIRSAKFVIPSDAVLLSRLNPRIRRVWFPDVDSERVSLSSTEFAVARPREGMSREFLFGLFTSDLFQRRFQGLVTGTSGSHQRVQPADLLRMKIPRASEEAVATYTERVRPMLQLVASNVRQSRMLRELRDLLLPKLISGEMRLKATAQEMAGIA